MSDESVSLGCDHCGGDAITSPNGMFAEDDGERCDTCGMAGSVMLSETYDADDNEVVQASWVCRLMVGDYCNEPNCEDCAEARKEAANG